MKENVYTTIYYHNKKTIQWMNTLIIAENVLIIKDDETVQLRISAVLLRKAGRWNVPYAAIKMTVIKCKPRNYSPGLIIYCARSVSVSVILSL